MPEQKLDINLPEEVAKGTYSNLAIISHSNSEFIIDFASMMPGVNKGNVCSRIIMTPQNAKRLLMALSDNISNLSSRTALSSINSRAPSRP